MEGNFRGTSLIFEKQKPKLSLCSDTMWVSVKIYVFLWFGWAGTLIGPLSMPLTILIGSIQNSPDNFIQISQSDSEFGQTSPKYHEEMLYEL